ncbi:protein FAR1-RELATED SEQUENCE 1-like [Juglans microcarpa x Juglans regia]|uniref:protein FAR1-RELATED SEQUENCE 1-like n=1 Tax=Juglans microcarpa x Juglans regia TaxID=2249226 RepID=UPI001B7D98EA|nr:protein FAR1-RELATED SEQUENCE 1-like [Juglans microcarpa x Juglans regia]
MRLTVAHNTHNHGLSLQKSRFFRYNKEVSETVKIILDTNDLVGTRLNKSYGSLAVGVGGFENLQFLDKDCRNYINKARYLRLGVGGAGALRDYFMRMQYKNNEFFALMDLHDDGRLNNVFGQIHIVEQPTKTRHRFCLWHILKKDPEKLGSYAAYRSGLKTQLMKCVYNTQTIEEFEKCWASYLVKDEVFIEEFAKLATYSADFNEKDCNVKCSYGLVQMRRILCRQILAIFKSSGIKSLPDWYILDRWRKDIKKRYTLIHSSYDAGDRRPNGNGYSILLNMCYGMITYAADSNEQFEDAKNRIHEMTECYRKHTRNRFEGDGF